MVRAGPAAFLLTTDARPSRDTTLRLRALREALSAAPPHGVLELIPGYTSLLVEHRPTLTEAEALAWLAAAGDGPEAAAGARHALGVTYGAGADVEELSARTGLPWPEIVRLHHEARYTVAFLGFTPGFPYLLGLPAALATSRRAVPHPRIAAGSVAIAGSQAGIYPSPSPGGWWVLGRTGAVLFDPGRDPPALLQPGDEVTFEPLAAPAARAQERAGRDGRREDRAEQADFGPAAPPAGEEALEVSRVWPRSASLQAAPRWGVGHLGMAQSGALDPLASEAANEILGNPRHAPALELIANHAELRAVAPLEAALTGGGLRLAVDGREAGRWQPLKVPAGAVLELVPDRGASGRTSYLAIAGGFAAHAYRGSTSTDARAGVGGLEGRYLRAGDRLLAGGLSRGMVRPAFGVPRYPSRLELRIHPGPQFERGAFERLRRSSFRLEVIDRMGARCSGPALRLETHEMPSDGSPWGAVQVPPDGQPIVLLADRGRTGGYAKPAVVDIRDLWKLAQAPLGAEIYFV